jgi:hypothetical protein
MGRRRHGQRAEALADYMLMAGIVVAIALAIGFGAYSGFLQDLVARIGSALDSVLVLST